LEIVAGIESSVDCHVYSSLTQHMDYTMGIVYEDRQWNTINEFNKSFDFSPPQLSCNAAAKAYIKPQFNIKIYDVVSPYLYADLYGNIEADVQSNPWWNLYTGADIGIGIKAVILGHEIFDFSTNPPLIQFEQLIASATQTPTGTFTDFRDGQIYATVEIGSQTWMAENLNYSATNSWTYDDDPANGNIYGRLYTWDAALNACPSGWHLPSDEEWTTLIDFLGGGNVAGGKMRETGTSHWDFPNSGATNSSGFTGLPGGLRKINGLFEALGDNGVWWSLTEYSGASAWYRVLYPSTDVVGFWYTEKANGFSVRCLKN
jgi:uncharacterized protein (TIGR02145 family)